MTEPKHPDKVTRLHPKPTIIPREKHIISRAQISDSALKVLYRLRSGGFQACLVGGSVRDLLLGREPKDFDVATDARPDNGANDVSTVLPSIWRTLAVVMPSSPARLVNI